jgi:flavorubredoxin
MYGISARVIPSIEQGLKKVGIPFSSFDVGETHISYILPALWESAGVVICAPTYEGGLFPSMEFVLEMADKKRMSDKKAIYVGSYGWGGGAMRFINKQREVLNWDLLGKAEFKGKLCQKTWRRSKLSAPLWQRVYRKDQKRKGAPFSF